MQACLRPRYTLKEPEHKLILRSSKERAAPKNISYIQGVTELPGFRTRAEEALFKTEDKIILITNILNKTEDTI